MKVSEIFRFSSWLVIWVCFRPSGNVFVWFYKEEIGQSSAKSQLRSEKWSSVKNKVSACHIECWCQLHRVESVFRVILLTLRLFFFPSFLWVIQKFWDGIVKVMSSIFRKKILEQCKTFFLRRIFKLFYSTFILSFSSIFFFTFDGHK